MSSSVIEKYLKMAREQSALGVDNHIEGKTPLCYAFGVPLYDPQDFLDWTTESNELIERKMQELGEVLRKGIGIGGNLLWERKNLVDAIGGKNV